MRRNVCFVRRFVFAEPRIPIDPKDRALGMKFVVGRQTSKMRLEGDDQGLHGEFHKRLIFALVFCEPEPIVVLLELLEERDAFLGEAFKRWVKFHFIKWCS